MVTMTSSNPPTVTHQPGLPADSASCKKPGGSPKPPSKSLHDTLVQCHASNGPIPKIGDLVWMWFLIAEKWQIFTVLEQREHRFGGPEYNILDTKTGRSRWMRYRKLYMPKE